jgi:hypothetical protein
MVAQPLPELGIDPVNDGYTNTVLIEQRRCQTQQWLVMKDPVA